MISMTKLYGYLNAMFAFVIVLSIIILVSNDYFVNHSTELVQDSIDNTKQIIREDLQNVNSKLDVQTEDLEFIRNKLNWVADNIQPYHSGVTNVTNVQLVHYFAEVEICSKDYPSYKIKVDFYGINPRIEDGKLMVLSEHFTADYHEYLPIFDKNIGYDANICSLKLLNK